MQVGCVREGGRADEMVVEGPQLFYFGDCCFVLVCVWCSVCYDIGCTNMFSETSLHAKYSKVSTHQ